MESVGKIVRGHDVISFAKENENNSDDPLYRCREYMISVSPMDELLHLLPSLIALVEEASVTRAARRLGVSQPRMSARLAQLRSALADPLLVASGGRRGLVATDRAVRIARTAGDLLRQLEETVAAEVFDPTTASRTLAIMANDNAAAIAGLPLAAAIAALAGPDLRTALLQFDATRLADLENGRLDLALGASTRFAAIPGLMSRVIVRDRFVAAVQRGTEPATTLDDYCARAHVLVSADGGGFDGPVDRVLARRERQRRVVLSVQSYLLAIEAVVVNGLMATLPRSLLAGHADRLTLFDPPIDLPPFSLSAAWHPRSDRDAAHRWMRSLLPNPSTDAAGDT
jgi:DNA-binding transcriptional LysR family regulator